MISVVVAIYNGAKFIDEQLESILNQSMKVNEIIICNDCSMDDSVYKINRILSSQNIPFKIINNKTNLGVSKNFEQGCKICTGDYIFFSDQDDIWKHDKVKKIMDNFMASNADLVYSNANLIYEQDGGFFSNKRYTLWDIVGISGYMGSIKTKDLIKKQLLTGATMAIKREVLEYALPFPNYCYHDYWISVCVSIYGNISGMEDCLINYRQHKNNVVGAEKKYYIRLIKLLNSKENHIEQLEKEIKLYKHILVRYGNFINCSDKDYIEKKIIFVKNIKDNKSMLKLIIYFLTGHFNKYLNGLSSFLAELLYVVKG